MNSTDIIVTTGDGTQLAHPSGEAASLRDLAAQNHLLEAIVQSTTDGICVANVHGLIVLQNRAMVEITGYNSQGTDVAAMAECCGLFSPDQQKKLKTRELPCQRALRGEHVRAQEIYLRNERRPEGAWLWVNASTLTTDAGAVVGAVAIYRDVTVHRREAAAEYRLSDIIRTSAAALTVIRLDGIILDWNQGAEQLLGYRAYDVIGHPVKFAVQPDRAEDFEHAKAELLRGVPVFNYETVRTHRDGTLINVAMTVAPITNRAGKIVSLYAIMTDIRDRKRREHHLAELANNERQRLGRDLHDTLGQQLTGIGMLTQALKDRLSRHAPTDEVLMRLESAVQDAKSQIRNILEGLSPVHVDARGLFVALAEIAEKARLEHGVDCRLECDDETGMTDNFIATQFYYIAREAVHNALVHAKPKRIDIRLTYDTGLHLLISDNGCGLPTDLTNCKGMGLNIMRYRSELIGAALKLESLSAGGTVVTCDLAIRGE